MQVIFSQNETVVQQVGGKKPRYEVLWNGTVVRIIPATRSWKKEQKRGIALAEEIASLGLTPDLDPCYIETYLENYAARPTVTVIQSSPSVLKAAAKRERDSGDWSYVAAQEREAMTPVNLALLITDNLLADNASLSRKQAMQRARTLADAAFAAGKKSFNELVIAERGKLFEREALADAFEKVKETVY